MAEEILGPDITGDGNLDLDITDAGDFGTIGGVIYTDAVNVGSGTGNYNTFLAISDNDGDESGFNSDDTPPIDTTNKDIDQAKTHTVLLSDLVIVTVDGVQYYEFRVDLNESNNDPSAQISLDAFQLYSSTDGEIVSTTDLFNENQIYDLDAAGDVSVLLSDASSSGSGTDDYSVLVPVSMFAGLDPTTTYIYLYVEMGFADTSGVDTWGVNGTFEEWNLENGVTLTGVKFADLDGDGIRDAGEGGIEGVTIFIDSNQNGVLDAGERTAVTDADGNYSFYGVSMNQTLWIDEDMTSLPAGTIQTTGDHEVVVIGEPPAGTEIIVDPIGNFIPAPGIHLVKSASVDSDCADVAGETVSYTFTVTNTGNVELSNIDLSDTFAENLTFTGGDTDADGKLDVNETWTYTGDHTVTQDEIDDNGGGDGELENTATVTGDYSSTTVSDDDSANVEVCQFPGIAIEKTAALDDGGDCVDEDGDIINYTYSVTNTGNVALDNVVVVDDKVTVVADDGDSDGFNDGDLDEDGLLDVNETWTYSASYTATQADIDSAGDGDGFIHNTVTANGDAAVGGEAAPEASDDASVEVCQNPGVDLIKYVDVGFGWDDANTGPGPENVNVGGDVSFKITVENTGNVTLTDVDITDTYLSGGAPGTANLLVDDGVLTQYAIDHGASLTGDTDSDGDLDVGETWEIIYTEAFDPLSFDPGAHLNTADVTTDEGVSDEDSAYYFTLVDTGLCPRTPGFWQNPNNGAQFWDGVVGNEKHAGEDGFPTGELLYAVDSNNDGVINAVAGDGINDGSPLDAKGLLIGDYDKDGLTGAGEDTLFVSFADAQSLINASNKQLNASTGDGRFMLGRDMVASWLNYLQGSGFGDASDPNSPHHYLDDSIDWMQIYSGTLSGGTTETFDKLKLSGGAIKTNTSIWKDVQSGFDHSAGQMHFALDYYNNTGQTAPGGQHYANCESQHLFEALSIFESAHPDLV